MRHARALSNEQGILITRPEDGHNGFGLVELGRSQALSGGELLLQQFGDRLRDALVISSPFLRARETARIMGSVAQLDWPQQIDDRLSERFFGEMDRCSVSLVAGLADQDRANPLESPHGIESPAAVATRFAELVHHLEQQHTGRLILLFSHMDTLRIFHRAIRADRAVQEYGEMTYWDNAGFKPLIVEPANRTHQ